MQSPWRLLLAVLFFAVAGRTQVNILTANGNNDRTNANLQEIVLSPATVEPSNFAKLAAIPVDGQVYSQPLVVSDLTIPGHGRPNVLYISTMHNTVYAFDADSLSPNSFFWRVTLGPSVPSQLLYGPYGDISPELGILSTGVIDLSRGVIYVVAEVLQRGRPAFYLHALDLATGAERLNGPVPISASVSGTGSGAGPDGTLSFDPMQHIQRPGLLLANESVYVAFGSHGDQNPYHGWMFAYDAGDLRRLAGVYVSTPDGNAGAIWQSGRGPAADRQGNIYAVIANGDYDGVRNFGQSFVRLPPTISSTVDSYTPVEWKLMSDNDLDLSAGPALISGTHTFVGADKLGNLYAIDGDAMRSTTSASVVTASESSIFNFAVWSSGASARVYTQGGREPVKCFHVSREGISPEPLYVAADAIPYARIGLTLSANGNQGDSGILWESAGNYNDTTAPGALYAYDASTLDLLWNSEMNPARDRLPPVAKFVSPTVANGRVYVPSSANVVTVYGLLSPPIGDPRPVPTISSVVNAASYAAGAVSPGELIVIFGNNLGPTEPAGLQFDANGMVASTLADAEVLFDGVPSPMVFAGEGQLNAVVPFGVSAPAALMRVTYRNLVSEPFPVNVAPAAVGAFSADASGTGPAAASNQDGRPNSPGNPAAPGSAVTLWVTGAGQLSPSGVDGAVADPASLPRPELPVLALVDDQPAEVLYAGGAPGFLQGVIQVNLRIPAAAPRGVLPVVIRVGDSASQPGITLAVGPP